MTFLISLDGLSCSGPDRRVLFENLTRAFGRERTGLVGRNGVGKTTLIRAIRGEIAPAAGALTVAARLGALRQTPSPPQGAKLADLLGVADEFARLRRLEAGGGRAGDLEAAAWDLPQRTGSALAEVGLDGVAVDRAAETLSGGEATRAALAALLIAAPDFILMDEPTNNLDAEGRAAVTELLDAWRGGALVVSHDRALLRRMDRIVDLTSLGAVVYGGGYDLYAERKAEAEAAAERQLASAGRTLARTERDLQLAQERKARRDGAGKRSRPKRDMPKSWFDGQAERAQNTAARQSGLAERLREAAERDLAEARARIERVRRLDFALPPSGLPAGKVALAFEDVGFAWPDGTPVLSGLTFRIAGPERLALTGANGAGKTTLIRLATGQLAPSAGRIRRGVAAVLLDQRTALLDDGATLLANFRRLNPACGDNAAHAALARFLFRNDAAQTLAGAASGGERLRAALACALMGEWPPQLIILDEPTNHLDLEEHRRGRGRARRL
ncbi:MAG TPA: ATP-binding cassette domain-containing protein [Caulobacteraceae bacterium]|nr:ATP-binding cassette domain-containing protein [Caulobacteraceae bacterium]